MKLTSVGTSLNPSESLEFVTLTLAHTEPTAICQLQLGFPTPALVPMEILACGVFTVMVSCASLNLPVCLSNFSVVVCLVTSLL